MDKLAKRNNEETQTSKPESEQLPSSKAWIIKELVILAEAFGESVSEQRLAINALDLADIEEGVLRETFKKCRRDLDWYPKVSQIRELALGKLDDRNKAEALRAYEFCCDFTMRYWQVDIGIYPGAPSIPQRTGYALRHIGGFPVISNRTVENEPFIRRDFIEAYVLAETASMMPELAAFDMKPLAAQKSLESAIAPKQLPGKPIEQTNAVSTKTVSKPDPPRFVIPLAYTPEQEKSILEKFVQDHQK